MSYGRLSWFKKALAALTVIIAVTGNCANNAQASQVTTQFSGKLLRKSADAGQVRVNQSTPSRQTVTIRLDGLQSEDLVNIRPRKGSLVEAAAGTFKRGLQPQGTAAPVKGVEPGQPLPDSALSVTPGLLAFVRPPDLAGIVFLDIQVPARARVRVLLNGDVVLKAALLNPLSFRNKEWGLGASTTSGAIMQAVMPSSVRSVSNRPAYHGSTGSYFVPFSSLRVLERSQFDVEQGQSSMAIIQIDEAGHVVGVTPMTDAPTPDLESTIRKWRFAPYYLNGRAVRVSTMLVITTK